MNDLAELLRHAAENANDATDNRTDAELARDLRAIFGQLTEDREPLHVGQIVVHRFPANASTKNAARPAVVLELFDKPIRPHEAPEAFENVSDWHNNSAARPLDMVIGALMDGRFYEYLADSRQYQPARIETLA